MNLNVWCSQLVPLLSALIVQFRILSPLSLLLNLHLGVTLIIFRFPIQFGIVAVRGFEIEGHVDEKGRLIDEQGDEMPKMKGDDRSIRVLMDCNQYHCDTVCLQFGKNWQLVL